MRDFTLSSTIEGTERLLNGRLGAIRVRDKTEEALLWRSVIETTGDEVRVREARAPCKQYIHDNLCWALGFLA
jgi:hypothetical protein